MLLWFDSLDYPATNALLQAVYPGSTGVFSGGNHPTPGRASLFGTGGLLPLPIAAQSSFGSDLCTVGMRIRLLNAYTAAGAGYSLIEFKDSGGVSKVTVSLQKNSNDHFFWLHVRTPSRVLCATPLLDSRKFLYLEFQVRFSASQGSVAFRVDGVENLRIENLKTDETPAQSFQSIVISLPPGSPPAITTLLSDIYVTDGTGSNKTLSTFLGPVDVFPRYPQGLKEPWAPNPLAPMKKRLVWLAGQSNMHGLGSLSRPRFPWRTPNPFVSIWWPRAGQWQPLEASVNTWGHLYPPPAVLPALFGAEMQFAERIATLFEKAGSTTSNVVILKTVVDASSVVPGDILLSWHPSQPASASNQAVAEFNAAVGALGGLSAIEHVDLFWYHGESETLADVNIQAFNQYTLDVLVFLIAACGAVPVSVHIVRINKYFPGIPGGAVRIQEFQEAFSAYFGTPLINTDDLALLNDYVHLANFGLDALGNRIFESWLKTQNYDTHIRDHKFPSTNYADSQWLGSSAPDANRIILSTMGPFGSPVLATSPRVHVEATSGDTLTVAGKQFAIGSNLPQWTLLNGVAPQFLMPEDLDREAGIQIS